MPDTIHVMQVFVLALVLGIFVHDSLGQGLWAPSMSPGIRLGSWLLPKAMLLGLYWIVCLVTVRRLRRPAVHRTLLWHDRILSLYRGSALVLYALDLYAGVLWWLRRDAIGHDWILVDELVLILPTLLMVGGAWWVYYPIDRRLREAALVRRLDLGQPIAEPYGSRHDYLVAQFRHQIAIMLVPLLLMLGWYEAVALFYPQADDTPVAEGLMPALLCLGGAGCVFLLAPVMIRWIWDTTPLPAGDVRERLSNLCRRYGVGFRELLLWRTFGGMINAAVMGVIAPLRYILLTDALLEGLETDQVEAVMAHEVAHVRHRHLPWLLIIAASALLALQSTCTLVVDHAWALMAPARSWAVHLDDPTVRALAGTAGALGLWLSIFGWVSRKFERQADTFAVAHMSRKPRTGEDQPARRVDDRAVQVLVQTLGEVAALNHIGLERRSWRHGSIASRQAYMRSLRGAALDRLPIDRTVWWIKALGLVTAVVLGAAYWIGPL